jgi:hypothetical protein
LTIQNCCDSQKQEEPWKQTLKRKVTSVVDWSRWWQNKGRSFRFKIGEVEVNTTWGIVRKLLYIIQNKLLKYFRRNRKYHRAVMIVMFISFIWLRIKIIVRPIWTRTLEFHKRWEMSLLAVFVKDTVSKSWGPCLKKFCSSCIDSLLQSPWT